ncbi:hypothetical protein F5I97DRAFT_1828263 [Phlebopus sp. FC_14]|nr:hypothetical protein F5I97DRAFT_1828263 [Phlebopus sp. FC_14]
MATDDDERSSVVKTEGYSQPSCREKGKEKQRITPSPSSSSMELSSDDEEKEGDEDGWGPRDEFKDLLMDNLSMDQSTHEVKSRLDFSKERLHPDPMREKPKTIHERLTDPKEAQVEGGWIQLDSRGPSMVMDIETTLRLHIKCLVLGSLALHIIQSMVRLTL